MCPVKVLQEPLYCQKPIFIALNRQKFKLSPSVTTNSKTVLACVAGGIRRASALVLVGSREPVLCGCNCCFTSGIIVQVDKSRQTGVNFLTKASRTDLACVQ